MASILVIDTDSPVREAVAHTLRGLGHEVSASGNADAVAEALETIEPDLMVIECDLPDASGIKVLTDVKQGRTGTPIRVVMTANGGGKNSLVEAFNSGADDVVTKPFQMDELVARIDACLRRPPAIRGRDELRAGGILIDSSAHRVFVDDQPVSLAPREYRLLVFLLTHPERVFSRQQLLAQVWGRNVSVGARTVDVHVRRLRSLLEPFGYDGYLQTVRGSGYRFSTGG